MNQGTRTQHCINFLTLTIFFLFELLSGHCYAQLKEANKAFYKNQFNKAKELYASVEDFESNDDAIRGFVDASIEYGFKIQMNGKTATNEYYNALHHAVTLVGIDSLNADNWLILGKAYVYNYQFDAARKCYEVAKSLRPDYGRVYYYFWALLPQDVEHIGHELVEKAMELEPDFAIPYMELGDYYKHKNELELALEHYLLSIERWPTYKASFSAAYMYLYKEDLINAKKYFSKAIELNPEFGWAWAGLASVELQQGENNNAIISMKNALKYNEQTSSWIDQYKLSYTWIDTISFQAQAVVAAGGKMTLSAQPPFYIDATKLAEQGYYYEAIELFELSYDTLLHYEDLNQQYEQSILSWMAHCYRNTGDYGAALHYAKSGLRIMKERHLETDMASSLANVAVICQQWGDYEEAIKYHLASIDQIKKVGQKHHLATGYNNLGYCYKELGQLDKSIHAYERAIQSSPSEDALITTHAQLAISFSIKGDEEQAKKYLKSFLEMVKKKHGKTTQHAYYISSIVLQNLGESKKALEQRIKSDDFSGFDNLYQKECLTAYSNDLHLSCSNDADSALILNSFQDIRSTIYLQIENNFPSLSRRGKALSYHSIKSHFEQFQSFVFNSEDPQQKMLEELLRDRVAIKGLLLDNQQKIRRKIHETDDKAAKKVYDNWSRSRNLLARVLKKSSSQVRKIDADSLKNKVEELEIEMNKFFNFNSNLLRDKTTRIETIQSQLKSNEAFIEVIRFRDYSFQKSGAFGKDAKYGFLILRGDGEGIQHTVFTDPLLETKYFNSYSNAIEYELEDSKSYNRYWGSLAKYLDGIKNVYLSPDGVYYKLNLDGLLNPKTKKYLLEEINLVLVPNAKALLTKDSGKKNLVAELVGYPNYTMEHRDIVAKVTKEAVWDQFAQLTISAPHRGSKSLSLLPGTLKEVNLLDSMLKAVNWKTHVLVGEDALEENVKKIDRPGILHIATHGYFDDAEFNDDPMLHAGLYLSGAASDESELSGKIEDGILTAYEAMNMDLDKTDLVVLSACETGSGKIENGEGVFGLQRAFIAAGAKNLIMSLWKVNDVTTTKLMKYFYSGYLQSADARAAFRDAKLKLKQEHPNPKYWAPFVLISTGR